MMQDGAYIPVPGLSTWYACCASHDSFCRAQLCGAVRVFVHHKPVAGTL